MTATRTRRKALDYWRLGKSSAGEKDMKHMKTVKHTKGLARIRDVAARLRRARSVADSNPTRPFQVPVRSCRLLSRTDRWAAAGGRHVTDACQPSS